MVIIVETGIIFRNYFSLFMWRNETIAAAKRCEEINEPAHFFSSFTSLNELQWSIGRTYDLIRRQFFVPCTDGCFRAFLTIRCKDCTFLQHIEHYD